MVEDEAFELVLTESRPEDEDAGEEVDFLSEALEEESWELELPASLLEDEDIVFVVVLDSLVDVVEDVGIVVSVDFKIGPLELVTLLEFDDATRLELLDL